MALILKTDKTFNPVISQVYGQDLTGSAYYGVIDQVHYDKKLKQCFFNLDIYMNKESAILRKSEMPSLQVVDRMQFKYEGEGFDTSIGTEGITIPKAYALASAVFTDWESDEII